MSYTAGAIFALAAQCAPNVAPETVAAIVRAESRGFPLALNVNGGKQPAAPRSVPEAIATARHVLAAGHSVDLGLGQINSQNMRRLGLSWKNVFDPCTNIAALGRVLTANYEAARDGRDPQTALRVAFSLYNTGNSLRGFRNGYVERVLGNTGVTDSSIRLEAATMTVAADHRPSTSDAAAPSQAVEQSIPSSWNLFERAAFDRGAAPRSDVDRSKSVWAR